MKTEIFIEPELAELESAEVSAEWSAICKELGLDGQVKLSEKSPELKPPPYRAIDPKTERIIRTLCPEKMSVEDYSVSAIPFDIVQEIKKCVDNEWYRRLYIFFDNKSPDPFLVGRLTADWNSPWHLIARWGDELLPFEELELKAVNRLMNEAKEALSDMKSKMEYYIQDPAGFIHMMLSGREMPGISFSVRTLSW
jgi:hypothetical protein